MSPSRVLACISLLGAVFALSCASEPTKPTVAADVTPKKEVALSTARPCLEHMAAMAARWQADALPYHLESEVNTEATGQDGRSSVWRANFASASRGMVKIFACSGSLLKNSPPYGVTADREFPSSATILTFPLVDLTVDSDAAAKIAQEHGGADVIKKNPKQPVYYELGMDPKSNRLLWAAVYGSNEKDNQGIAMIEATHPRFVGVLKH